MAKVILHLRNYELTALNDPAQPGYRAPRTRAALIIRRQQQKPGRIPVETPLPTQPDILPVDETNQLEMKGG